MDSLKVLHDESELAAKWSYRALLMSKILEYLGYNTANIMNGDKEVLADYIKESPSDIIYKLQMVKTNYGPSNP